MSKRTGAITPHPIVLCIWKHAMFRFVAKSSSCISYLYENLPNTIYNKANFLKLVNTKFHCEIYQLIFTSLQDYWLWMWALSKPNSILQLILRTYAVLGSKFVQLLLMRSNLGHCRIQKTMFQVHMDKKTTFWSPCVLHNICWSHPATTLGHGHRQHIYQSLFF